ncbi:MAG TPA: magnesium/cobalt transporter CorA [Actinomycetota bacterium]|jgi:magnesium transporter|nr:magnesium/cobalt transporter CorA [Actinomycetota bacterium]
MIQAHVFRQGREVTDIDISTLSEVRTEKGTLVWVDVVSATPQELAQMGEEFGIHELALEDLAHPHQRPKLEDYPDQVLLVAYGAESDEHSGRVRLHEVDVVAGRGWALTFHGGRPLDTAELARRIRGHPELLRSGSGFLLYVILDELVDTFFPALDMIGGRVEDLEEAIFEERSNTSPPSIYELRKELIAVRRVAGPMRDAMVVLLRRDLGLFTREAQRYLEDVYDHLIRVVEQVEDYQDLTANALDVNLSMSSNRVNEVARTLTAYAAIFAAITLITGIYGMNFRHMPELAWTAGYGYALGLMVAAAGALWLYFRRKRWL